LQHGHELKRLLGGFCQSALESVFAPLDQAKEEFLQMKGDFAALDQVQAMRTNVKR
jgi:hypothetical protein